jgi:FlaA1/EpsC-like NDP-sugar epimerase
MKQLFELNKEIFERPIIIYGAGNTGLDLLVELTNRNVKVECFCDSSNEKYGIRLMNKKVISLDELCQRKDEFNVVIASIFFEEIKETLEKRGIENIFCYKNHWRIQI